MASSRDNLKDTMGLRTPDPINYVSLAKRLRSACNGAFGKMKPARYNARVLGTSFPERVSE